MARKIWVLGSTRFFVDRMVSSFDLSLRTVKVGCFAVGDENSNADLTAAERRSARASTKSIGTRRPNNSQT
jgi:hypothetical protein